MAGRPVAARGGNGMLYGLIAFVIVAVASLGAFVWQLTANKALQSENENASRRLTQYGQPPSYYQEEATARGSKVFTVMNDDLEGLALLVAGKKEAVRPALEQAANQLLRNIADTSPGTIEAGDTLLTALRKLHGAYVALEDKQRQLLTELEEARLENQALGAGLKEVRDGFEAQVADLKQELERTRQEQREQLAAKDEQLARQQAENETLNEQLNQLRTQQQARERDHDIALTRLRNQINDLQSKLQELRPGGFDPYDILTRADGLILRAIPGSDIVYINLGERDRIRPGMTFEVFSPVGGERRADFRGKASIEVLTVLDTTAECRVLRSTPGRPIVEGDAIVNIVYDKARLPKFVVRGEFDLNYDGEKEFDGPAKVAAMVRAWGGQVVEQIDETTDFLVVGMGPQPPLPAADRPVTDVIRSLTDMRLDQLQQYRADIEQARTLNIPIITQTQFLFLTGYSGAGPILVD